MLRRSQAPDGSLSNAPTTYGVFPHHVERSSFSLRASALTS